MDETADKFLRMLSAQGRLPLEQLDRPLVFAAGAVLRERDGKVHVARLQDHQVGLTA